VAEKQMICWILTLYKLRPFKLISITSKPTIAYPNYQSWHLEGNLSIPLCHMVWPMVYWGVCSNVHTKLLIEGYSEDSKATQHCRMPADFVASWSMDQLWIVKWTLITLWQSNDLAAHRLHGKVFSQVWTEDCKLKCQYECIIFQTKQGY
jgi:hypothetical protein